MKNNKKPDYPRNLFITVIGEDYEYPITSKTIERFENFLNSFLSTEVTEEEKEILLLYFKEGMSQTKISVRYNTSRTTITNRINKILFKLRTLKNINQYIKFEEDYTIYIERIKSLITQLNNPQVTTVSQDDLMTDDDVRDEKDDKIENMKLSKRAYNALKRARINTVSEIVDLLNTIDVDTKKNKIYNTINIGPKVYNNILEALDLYYMSNDFFKTKYKLKK
jgi:predicted DNA-binding protein YlxM (UPF0122 family)